jgi:hypothetical protein
VQAGQSHGGIADMGAVLVFLHAHVSLSVDKVFHGPVVATELSQGIKPLLLQAEAGDGIGLGLGGFPRAMFDDRSLT